MGAKEYISNAKVKDMIKSRQIRKDFVIVTVNPLDDRDITLHMVWYIMMNSAMTILSKWTIINGKLVKLNEAIPDEAYTSLYDSYLKFVKECKANPQDTIFKAGYYKSLCAIYSDIPMENRKIYKNASDTFAFVLKDNRVD